MGPASPPVGVSLLSYLSSAPSPVSSVMLPPPLGVSSRWVGARWWWWQRQRMVAVLTKNSPAQRGWGHLAATNCCCEVLWGSRSSNRSTHAHSFEMVGSSAYARAQTSKKKLNLKFNGDFHLRLTVHLDEDIFRPCKQDLSQDQQAHWLQCTSGQNPQF